MKHHSTLHIILKILRVAVIIVLALCIVGLLINLYGVIAWAGYDMISVSARGTVYRFFIGLTRGLSPIDNVRRFSYALIYSITDTTLLIFALGLINSVISKPSPIDGESISGLCDIGKKTLLYSLLSFGLVTVSNILFGGGIKLQYINIRALSVGVIIIVASCIIRRFMTTDETDSMAQSSEE